MKLAYLANIRLPTEKAHGLQITQMCEAFAQTRLDNESVDVTLYVARRVNTPQMNAVRDIWVFYGVERVFTIRRIACLDIYGLLHGRAERLAFAIQSLSYLAMLCVSLIFQQADVYYSRDPLTLLALSFFKPRRALCYEAHQLVQSRIGKRLQSLCVRRVGTVVAITGTLAERLRERGARHSLIAHDGIRAARFDHLPTQIDARRELELPADSFIVGYVGRLHTMGMSKGINTLIEAICLLAPEPISLCLVGGPDPEAMQLRDQWTASGLDAQRFIYAGAVAADRVPIYLSACDVLAMPLPWTDHFAYYTSSLKLFEYMAARRALLVTDLPSVVEVVQDDHSALLTKPGDAASMADGLRRLKADPALCERLAAQAQADVHEYQWSRRAANILQAIINA